MYLSRLLIDVGDNPDRPRPARVWLRNLYHVHQRLCMAFPSASRKAEDAHFLQPFRPEDFGKGHVHTKRSAETGFLFRVDPQPGGRVAILVQSGLNPDWDYAFHNAGFLLAAPPQVRSFDPRFAKGESLRFRLVANPTRRLSKKSWGPDGNPVKEDSIGRRVPVPPDQLKEWLSKRAGPAGFSIEKNSVNVQPSYIYFTDNKSPRGKGNRLRSARYDGVLLVTDPDRFQKALIAGFGPGKAFGFGLLSVMRDDR